MLNYENLQQIAKLLLHNFFIVSELQLRKTFKKLRKICSFLFDKFLSRFEHENENINFTMSIMKNEQHLRSTVLIRIKTTFCREQFFLSIRESALFSEFEKMLRITYKIDYNMIVIYVLFFDVSICETGITSVVI